MLSSTTGQDRPGATGRTGLLFAAVAADGQPGFAAEKPEHCFACYRLIRPGQTYHLTIEFEVLCEDCALSESVIRVREDRVVKVKRDRLLIQRGRTEVEVFPDEIRHLVNALTGAAVRLVGQEVQER